MDVGVEGRCDMIAGCVGVGMESTKLSESMHLHSSIRQSVIRCTTTKAQPSRCFLSLRLGLNGSVCGFRTKAAHDGTGRIMLGGVRWG